MLSDTRTQTAATTRQTPRDARTAQRARAGGSAAASGVTTAVLLATAPADDGGPAAGLPWEDGTILGRLLGQLADIGMRAAHVITRPAWAAPLRAAIEDAGVPVELHACEDAAADLRTIADIAAGAGTGVMVAYGDIVTHREALAGLIADPRIATGILTTGPRRPLAFRVRGSRGRLVSASSPYHSINRPNATFLGVLKVSPADRLVLAQVAERLSGLLTGPLPLGWDDELERKANRWRRVIAVRGAREGLETDADGEGSAADLAERLAAEAAAERGDEAPDEPPVDPAASLDPHEPAVLSPEDEAEVQRRIAVTRDDVTALLVTGLVRSGAHLGTGYLRKLFWSRPLSHESLLAAAEQIRHYDEDKVLLDSAVKATDGFFTTFFVSPYSRYIARWASRVGLTPNQITTVSVAIGFLAAGAFATGQRWGLVAGAILLQVAFTTDCVDGQLARYTRTFTKLGAWLDSVFDRTKEYAVFAGLAIGGTQLGEPVWVLAAAALTLQTTRHMLDFSYAAAQHQVIGSTPQAPLEHPSDTGRPPVPASERAAVEAAAAAAPARPADPSDHRRRWTLRSLPARTLRFWRRFDRLPMIPWVKRMIAFPIGERFAVISITAAVWTPHTTFVVLLVWGGIAAAYTFTGRVLRSISR